MMIARNIRKHIGVMLSGKKVKMAERRVYASNLSRARKVGVLYNATSRDDHEKVKRFVQFLLEEQKDVASLGYIDSKDEKHFPESRLCYRYFTGKDINWLMQPSCRESDDFLKREYDLLIDLNLGDCVPLRHLTMLSSASFKVGAGGNYRDECCDMLIDVSAKKTVEYLIIQLKHYLQLINKEQ